MNINPANPVIGVRSFSSDPKLVAKNVSAAVSGLQDQQVTATAKHFPGHGDTGVDSHYALPTIDHTRAEWEKIDAPPFRAAIKAGVDAIMTAHIIFPAFDDSGDPSTLSHKVLTGVLRDELKFTGVIATDSLRMEGVRQKYDDAEIAIRAVEAGADVLLDPQQPALQIQAVIDAVRSGRLSEDRIDASVHRILIMKSNRGVLADPLVDETRVSSVVGNPQHTSWAQEITDQHHHPGRRRGGPGAAAGEEDVRHRLGHDPGAAARGGTDRTRVDDRLAGHRHHAERRDDRQSPWPRPKGPTRWWSPPRPPGTAPHSNSWWLPCVPPGSRCWWSLCGTRTTSVTWTASQSYLVTYSSTTVAVESALRVITGENKPAGSCPSTSRIPIGPAPCCSRSAPV